LADLPAEPQEDDAENEASMFIAGNFKTQAELLALRSHLVGNGIEDAAIDEDEEKAEEDEEKAEQERLDDEISDMSDDSDEYYAEMIADDSPYRNMASPGSRYNYCWNDTTPEEKQNVAQANQTATQAEQAMDTSAQAAPDGKPSVDAVVNAASAKNEAASTDATIVQKYGNPADSAKAGSDLKITDEKRKQFREFQRREKLAATPEEKAAIFKQMFPELVAEREKKAAAEMQRRNGVQPNPTPSDSTATATASPVPVEPASSQTVTDIAPVATASVQAATGGVATIVTGFNAAAGQTPALPVPAPDPAQDAGKLLNDNRALLEVSAGDNLDDPDNKLNNSLWFALDKKPDIVDRYDDAVDKQQATFDTLEKTPSADNFLAYRQAVIDRKLAVNDVILADYSANGKTADLSQAQTDRAKLIEEQKTLGDLKTQMAGKSDAEKADLLRAAFPPDPKSGEKLSAYDDYLEDKQESSSGKPADDKTAADPDDDLYVDDPDYINDWILDGSWYDDGSGVSAAPLPGSGIKDPSLNLSQNFTALASGQPAGTTPVAELAPGSAPKLPSALA
jgi:hypothetical protein